MKLSLLMYLKLVKPKAQTDQLKKNNPAINKNNHKLMKLLKLRKITTKLTIRNNLKMIKNEKIINKMKLIL
jgi:hypothetical protein